MSSRLSRQREVVLEVVRSTMDHPTAAWVHRQARRRVPRISLGTVYRNLKHLAGEGLIREIQAAGHSARFDGNTGRHYHIRCLGCGRVNDLPLSVDTRIEDQAGRAMNYRVLGHSVEVQGLCPLCRDDDLTGTIPDNAPGAAGRAAARTARPRDLPRAPRAFPLRSLEKRSEHRDA